MVKKTERVDEDALMLTEEEREGLLELLEPPPVSEVEQREIDQSWIEEADRVYQAVQEGTEKLIPAEDAMRELRRVVAE